MSTPGNEHSIQNLLNWSWDNVKKILGIGMVGWDGTNPQVIKTNTSGELIIGASTTQTLLDDVTTTNMTYVGTAPIGTATSASAWTIKRIDESGTPTTLVVKYATAGASTCIWDNRASLSFS